MRDSNIKLGSTEWPDDFGPIISPVQLASLLGLSVKTIYEWVARGRLDGAYRKRGKHLLIMRDLALELIMNGPEWRNDR